MNTIEKLLLVGVASCFILMLMIFRLPDGLLHSWFLNIGQGDAALIRGPMGELVLIDGGPDSKVMERMGAAIMPYEREIELVVVSHPHADHLNGLLDVFKAYQVKNLLITGVKYEYAGYRELVKMAEKNGTKIWYADGSFDFKIGRIGLDLIYPMTSMRGRSIENVNNSSIVMRVIYGDRKLLFSGDLE
ncbi:MBL fold metallo-hydrolase, partial [Candidatus Peregrinibacteria bacterium]|nr:MBL fold metallo-hydrolase [Candidatus Peregrinibacteria bacterium]